MKIKRIIYFRLLWWLRRQIVMAWLRFPIGRAIWIKDAKEHLEAFTEDEKFSKWYARELYQTHIEDEHWSSYLSGSDVAQEDMSYWGD